MAIMKTLNGYEICDADARDRIKLLEESGTGEPGESGRSIVSIDRTSGTGAAGTTDTYTITYTDGTTSTFTVYNGKDGEKGNDGKDGISIIDVRLIKGDGAPGTIDQYAVVMSDGAVKTFNVYNGKDGNPGKSAYEYAQDGGYTGTEAEFAEMLATDYGAEIDKLSEKIVDLGGVTNYVQDEAERVAKNVYSHQNANTFTFLAVSDIHYLPSHADISKSTIHVGQGMNLVRKDVNIDFATCLGDNGWGSGVANDVNRATIEKGVAEIRGANKYIDAAFRGVPNFRVPGNHDSLIYNYEFNGNDYLDDQELFPLYGAYNRGSVYPIERERGYCYRDFDEWKLRVICVNTSDIQDLSKSASTSDIYISGTQGKWFAETLDMSAKSNSDEWSILILSHAPLDWGVNCIWMCNILKAYIDGGSVSVTRDGVTISYNYLDKNAATIIGNCHGHNHNFQVDYLRKLISGTAMTEPINLKRFCIPNACFTRTNEKGENGKTEILDIEYGETTSYEKVSGTAQDTAFCVVTVDPVKKMIYADAYGAGYDRVVSYADEEVEVYTVSNNLTNCTNNNSSTQIVGGSSYVATITANSGYTLDSVSVTMGGFAVSVSGGVINIPNVTGDIIITAIASESAVTPSYTNQIPLSINADGSQFVGENSEDGYKVGYRLSTTSGNEIQQAGISVTGFIHIPKTATIRIKNMTFSSTTSTWCMYDTNFTRVNGGYCNAVFAQNENGVWEKTFANVEGYIRVSGEFGTNPIVTVNEEII